MFGIVVALTLYNWAYISPIQNHHSSVAESSLRLVRQVENYKNLMTSTDCILDNSRPNGRCFLTDV